MGGQRTQKPGGEQFLSMLRPLNSLKISKR